MFNLKQDSYEKKNLAAEMPDKGADLRQRLANYAKQAIPPKSAPIAAGFQSPAVWGEK